MSKMVGGFSRELKMVAAKAPPTGCLAFYKSQSIILQVYINGIFSCKFTR